MKKKIAAIACILALVLAIPAAAVSGYGQNSDSGTAVRSGASEGQIRVRSQALQVKENNLRIRLMNTENYSLRLECRQRIQEIKAGEQDLTEEQLTQLNDLRLRLQEQHRLLAETMGGIHELMLNFRADRLNQDYDAMSADLEAIMEVQQTRMTIKEEIGRLTQQILDVLG